MAAPGSLEAFLLPTRRGNRFCVHRSPPGTVRGSVVHVHAFAEEMNRARRSVALQSGAITRLGYSVLGIDLGGCGDSEGDLASCTWQDWTDDVCAAVGWLQARHDQPVWLWGLRAGCLVAAAALRSGCGAQGLLLVQPPVSGQQVLRQFLRLHSAMHMTDAPVGKPIGAKQLLASGESVEVAGYLLGPALAQGLAEATMDCGTQPTRIACLRSASGLPMSAGESEMLDRWRTSGHHASSASVELPPFWQTGEPADGTELVREFGKVLEGR